MRVGALYRGKGRCGFRAWAPLSSLVETKLVFPEERVLPMERDEHGYWLVEAEDVYPGAEYVFRIEGERERPDPASFHQPKGVHLPSAVVDHDDFQWRDRDFEAGPLERSIIYEMHPGTFTDEGTLQAAVEKLDHLVELGVDAIEIMPVSQFPGDRNWGYDGVHPYAVQNTYGGPRGLKAFVNGAHQHGVAVILDVVYNHLGPEGNYLWDFGPYFTDRYKTPWGEAVNFDGPYSDGVRNYFIENALYWLREFHVDGLRLDAVHGIFDFSARPFLAELSRAVDAFAESSSRRVHLIAESDLSDEAVIRSREEHGLGMHAQWLDDFHHSVHTLITAERAGYYRDYGEMGHLEKCLARGFVYSGQYSRFRKRRFGSSSADQPASKFIVFVQDHDQVGNRMNGERPPKLMDFESRKLMAGAMLLSPYIPMLFMGEEWDEDNPFLYFVSHGDPELANAVREGRVEEFASFAWKGEPPDPADPETFRRSKIDWKKKDSGGHALMLSYYRTLIELRRSEPAFGIPGKEPERLSVMSGPDGMVLAMERARAERRAAVFMNFSDTESVATLEVKAGRWRRVVSSADERFGGPGTTLPEFIDRTSELTLRRRSLAAFLLED